jgi:maltose/moltooligosaccharide transporter
MKRKPTLSFWQIWNMSFGYLGIQFGFALQNANVSRIFETLGAEVDKIPILWVAAPVSGLIVQPIIGHMSDKTWNRLGRRKPYFLTGAILASLALLIMPNSPFLWFAAGMLWIMDASINISMEPFRAFVGDMLPEEQRTQGFAMQTFFIGVGSVIASALPWLLTNWLHIANEAPDGELPPSVIWSFAIGGVVFIITVLWTIISTKEYSPEEQESFHVHENDRAAREGSEIRLNTKEYYMEGLILVLAGLIFTFFIGKYDWDKELYILSIGVPVYGIIQWVSALRFKNGKIGGMVEIIYDLKNMPKTMKQLAVVQFFTWFALFSMFIYSTSAVTVFHFGAVDKTEDTYKALYNEGANWVGILMGVYNAVAALIAFLLPRLAKVTGRIIMHVICLLIGGVGLASMYLITDPTWLILSMTGVGIAWAGILTFPYAILTSVIPHRKMGIYMGIFNFFIVIPQIIATSILGLMVRTIFHGQAIYTLVAGGVSMVIAAIIMGFVKEKSHKG